MKRRAGRGVLVRCCFEVDWDEGEEWGSFETYGLALSQSRRVGVGSGGRRL